jgi:hypothetical protein
VNAPERLLVLRKFPLARSCFHISFTTSSRCAIFGV